MARTSLSHPLWIATVPTPGGGAVGLTLCPGKKDSCALTGAWDRELETDLASIQGWGAAAVVTLVHDDELELLAVPGLGAAVEALGLAWVHLPIVDVAVPDAAFEQAWRVHGPMYRYLLRAGRRVLVHCRCGLGRAGTVAARLLVELGTDPEKAIRAVREARPGAIETDEQAAHVRACKPAPAEEPGRSAEARATSLLGLAVGDALGTTLSSDPATAIRRLRTWSAAARSAWSRGSGPTTRAWRSASPTRSWRTAAWISGTSWRASCAGGSAASARRRGAASTSATPRGRLCSASSRPVTR